MTEQLIAELDAFEGHAYAVAFSPDGKRLLVGGFGGLIRVYDTASWHEVGQHVHHEKSTNHIAFAPDNDTFAVSSSDRTISIWRAGSQEPAAILKGHRNTVMGLSWSPDGSRLASAATDTTIRIWNPANPDTKPVVLKSPYRIVSHVEYLEGGTHLASGGGGDEVIIWDVESQEIVGRIPGHGSGIRSMQIVAPYFIVTQAFDGKIGASMIGNWDDRHHRNIWPYDSKAPRSFAISPRGNRFAILEEKRVRVELLPEFVNWTWREFPLPVKGVHRAAFSPDGNLLAVTAADGKARVWNLSE